MTAQELAARVKAKYPEYAEVPDDELARRVIAKYPEYGEMVTASVADEARDRLADRGLTPEMVKGGQLRGEGEMREATGSENARAFGVNAGTGFLGALAAIPAVAVDYTMDTVTAGSVRRLASGIGEYYSGKNPNPDFGRAPMPLTEAVGNARRASTEAIKEGVGVPREAITDVADASGQATGEMAANFVPMSGAAKAGQVRGANWLERAAQRQYKGALRPSAANDALADRVVPELLERGETFIDPANLARRADKAADAIDVDAIVAKHAGPQPAQPMIDKLRRAQVDQFDNVGGRWVPKDTESEAIVDDLQQYIDIIEKHAVNGEVDPQQLLGLRQRWDKKPGERGFYQNPNAKVSDPMANRMAAADSVREQLNTVPEVSAANAEKSLQLNIKKLAEGAPEAKAPVTGTQGALGVLGFAVGGPAGATAASGTAFLWRFMQSPAYKTVSAVTKKRIADALRSGNLNEAETLAGSVAQEAEQNKHLQPR